MPQAHLDGIAATFPRTEIEIGAVCPNGATCTPHQSVNIRFHWVCPGQQFVNSNKCPELDFDVTVSFNGKLAFTGDRTQINANTPFFPAPPCPHGYLIG
jgi:hypothetical protein